MSAPDRLSTLESWPPALGTRLLLTRWSRFIPLPPRTSTSHHNTHTSHCPSPHTNRLSPHTNHLSPHTSHLLLRPDGSSKYVLVAANNRDEFFLRETSVANFWEDNPDILAGRDMMKGGTWLGISKTGRFAVLTNHRKMFGSPPVGDRSRGLLVSGFLKDRSTPAEYCKKVLQDGSEYDGFSLITACLSGPTEVCQAAYCCNQEGKPLQPLKAGLYGLSNQVLDSPWAKVEHGKSRFRDVLSRVGPSTDDTELTEQLMDILSDQTSFYPDPNVPDCGFPESWMKSLNSVFVSIPEGQYGTRTSTVVLVDRDGKVTYTERTKTNPFDCPNSQWSTCRFSFNISTNEMSRI